MSFYGGRKCSLIEQKKQQWAKEKGNVFLIYLNINKVITFIEELAHLSTPWGRTYTKLDKTLVRYIYQILKRITIVLYTI